MLALQLSRESCWGRQSSRGGHCPFFTRIFFSGKFARSNTRDVLKKMHPQRTFLNKCILQKPWQFLKHVYFPIQKTIHLKRRGPCTTGTPLTILNEFDNLPPIGGGNNAEAEAVGLVGCCGVCLFIAVVVPDRSATG